MSLAPDGSADMRDNRADDRLHDQLDRIADCLGDIAHQLGQCSNTLYHINRKIEEVKNPRSPAGRQTAGDPVSAPLDLRAVEALVRNLRGECPTDAPDVEPEDTALMLEALLAALREARAALGSNPRSA